MDHTNASKTLAKGLREEPLCINYPFLTPVGVYAETGFFGTSLTQVQQAAVGQPIILK